MSARGFSWRQTTVAKTEAAERPIRINEAAALAMVLGVNLFDLFDPGDSEDEYETLRAVLDADTAVTVARQRVKEAEASLEVERENLRAAEQAQEIATRRFHEVRGIDHDEVNRGEHPAPA